jgi:hypothetical protein
MQSIDLQKIEELKQQLPAGYYINSYEEIEAAINEAVDQALKAAVMEKEPAVDYWKVIGEGYRKEIKKKDKTITLLKYSLIAVIPLGFAAGYFLGK